MGAPMINNETIYSICNGDAKAMEALRKRISRNAAAWEGFKFEKLRPLDETEADKVKAAIADKRTASKGADGQKDAITDVRKDTDSIPDVLPTQDADNKTSGDNSKDASADRNISVEAYKVEPEANVPPAAFNLWNFLVQTIKQLSLKKPALWAVMLAPAVASFQNVYHVTGDIVNEPATAALLTVTFVCAPFVFVYVGLRSRAIIALTAVLIALEAFCNTVRIYGGLTGFGHRGNPTRFLGIVCELFNTGTYATATVLAAIFSSLAACVMYAAYNQVRK